MPVGLITAAADVRIVECLESAGRQSVAGGDYFFSTNVPST